jgi:hypothetical protein
MHGDAVLVSWGARIEENISGRNTKNAFLAKPPGRKGSFIKYGH